MIRISISLEKDISSSG